ncbi:MAG: hypothetical protein H0X11_09480, partial [Betaproteobacteria bacterium]|nr:hypothetical protein [Betaproteobacteria bacterium]
MTAALRINPTTTATTPDTGQLVPIDVAAKLMGAGDRILRRQCQKKLVAAGLAFFVTPPEGGHAKWFIHRSYDPRLRTLHEQARETPDNLSDYSDRQQKLARLRLALVERFRHERQHTPDSIDTIAKRIVVDARERFPELRVSRSQLYEWHKQYDCPVNLWKLIDQRGGDRRSSGSVEAWAAFKDLYLHQNQPTKRHTWKQVKRLAEANGWDWCSLSACKRQLNDRIPVQDQVRHRQPATYRQQ